MERLVYGLPFIAGIGFIVGIILLIIAAVKKKPKNVSVIIIIVSILLGIVGVVLSANLAVKDLTGGKMKTGDIIYFNNITEPLNDMTVATNEYTAVIQNPDPENPEWIERHDEAVADMQEASNKFKNEKPGPNTKEIADEAEKISVEVDKIAANSKDTFKSEDVGKHLEMVESAQNILKHYQTINTHLMELTSEADTQP